MGRLMVLAFLLLVPAGAAAAANDFGPNWSSDTRYVTFTREAGRAHDHFAFGTEAGRGRNWQLGPGTARGWQPHGVLVLVQNGGATNVLRLSGELWRRIDGTGATWSPDGKQIAFASGGVVYVENVADAGSHPVFFDYVHPSWDVSGAVWSPDGSRLAIASGSSIWSVSADGSAKTLVFNGPNQNVNPSWSPDGSTIAFESNADQRSWSIWLVGADGSSARRLPNGGWNDRFPQWAPTSGRIAFISDRQQRRGGATPYQYALFVQGDGRPQKLVDDVHPGAPPRWSPTGAQLAVAAGQACRRFGIYVVRSEPPAKARRRTNGC